MCGRYYIQTDTEELSQIIAEVERRQGNSDVHAAMKVGEVFPTNIVPVISGNGAELMKWGYSGYKNRVINARSETAFGKPIFRKSMIERRCLIPASGYYEWQHTQSGGNRKQKYALYCSGRPIYMAGLWRLEQDEALPVFVILTRGAGPGIAVIHDRMPVILPEPVRKAWISDSSDVGALMEKAVDEVAFRAI